MKNADKDNCYIYILCNRRYFDRLEKLKIGKREREKEKRKDNSIRESAFFYRRRFEILLL